MNTKISTRILSFVLLTCLMFCGSSAMACGALNHTPDPRQDIHWNPGNFGG